MVLGDAWKLFQIWRKLKGVDMKLISWRKVTAAIAAATIQAVGKDLGLTPDQINWISGILVSFIIGQGLADIGKGKAVIEAKAKKDAVALEKE